VIPLARRYSLAALALFAIAAVPIWLHRIGSARTDACLRLPLQHLAAYGENYAVVEVNERDALFLDIWVDGKLPPFAGRRPLFFRIVRSWDPFRFYNDLPRYFLHGSLPEAPPAEGRTGCAAGAPPGRRLGRPAEAHEVLLRRG
jgi:hypothetical protein